MHSPALFTECTVLSKEVFSLASPSPRLVKLLVLSNQQARGGTSWPDCLTGLTLSFRGFQLG